MTDSIDISTNNVYKELLRIAAQNSIPISRLYIRINEIQTFIKNKDAGLVKLSDEELNRYIKEEEALRDAEAEFEQQYDITVSPYYKGYPFLRMICEIEFNEDETLAYFIIKRGSQIEYYDNIYDDFLDYIDEKKLRAGILFYLFDVDFETSIEEFVKAIKRVKKVTFKEDKKILVAKGLEAVESIEPQLHMSIEENNNVGVEDSSGRIDYSNRGFMLSCAEGEELFEFIKPQQGKHGRSCKGKIIEVQSVNLDVTPTFTVEDGIEVQDSFENIKYLSKKSGYLVKNGDKYDVANSIDVDEISFKTTGTINSNLDSEITINVVKNNPLEDAIEEGMHVKVQNIFIQGSVGPNAHIEAREVKIEGQTHGDSSIKCINATISLHKGKVTARKVEVKNLEGGEIIADEAIVKNATRGKIRAKKITIENLGSHVTMEASQYIEIEKIRGEENIFILDSLVNSGFDDSKSDDDIYFKKTKEEFDELEREFKDSARKVKESLKSCQKIKELIIKNQSEKQEIPLTLIKNFKICKIIRVRYKKLKEKFDFKQVQYDKLKEKVLQSYPDIFEAKILLGESLRGFNHITYKLHHPDREIELRTNERMSKKIFELYEDDDGVLKIINSK
ncbi:MAG: FapA family protein [Sulfurimonas sp.]|uniref:flagellar assembly protein A n=1 Tax=Sulfurimonas sp. TaxID=2022749 RepID=UPI0025FA1C85|nr:flagellar assembly protein A [Sulfurimonas sp.]MCK9490660.1 FapA family protein [Sulfurimonas sp.]